MGIAQFISFILVGYFCLFLVGYTCLFLTSAIMKKAARNILLPTVLEHIYFVYVLEIYLGIELLDLSVWRGSALVGTTKVFHEIVFTILLLHTPFDSSISKTSQIRESKFKLAWIKLGMYASWNKTVKTVWLL